MQTGYYARGLGFLPKLAFIITVGVITAAASYQTVAADVFTDPVGFITMTAEGTTGPGSSPANSFWGLPLTALPVSRGVTAASITSAKIGVNDSLTPGAFNAVAAGNQYYIEITDASSAVVGFTDDIVSNDANNVFTATDDSALDIKSKSYKIFPHWTIASVFGPNDESGLNPGTPTTADAILVQNPVTKGFGTYFYATASKTLGAGWKNAGTGNTDASLTPLYQDQGIVIQRQVTTNLAVKVIGGVKLGKSLVPLIGPGNTFAANMYAAVATTLGASGLYTDGNPVHSLVAGTPTTADQVLIHNDVTGGFNTYFFATASKTLGAGWKNAGTGNTDASGTPIPMGANIVIVLQPGDTGFNWTMPAPY